MAALLSAIGLWILILEGVLGGGLKGSDPEEGVAAAATILLLPLALAGRFADGDAKLGDADGKLAGAKLGGVDEVAFAWLMSWFAIFPIPQGILAPFYF